MAYPLVTRVVRWDDAFEATFMITVVTGSQAIQCFWYVSISLTCGMHDILDIQQGIVSVS